MTIPPLACQVQCDSKLAPQVKENYCIPPLIQPPTVYIEEASLFATKLDVASLYHTLSLTKAMGCRLQALVAAEKFHAQIEAKNFLCSK